MNGHQGVRVDGPIYQQRLTGQLRFWRSLENLCCIALWQGRRVAKGACEGITSIRCLAEVPWLVRKFVCSLSRYALCLSMMNKGPYKEHA